jgi:hypothetical protein
MGRGIAMNANTVRFQIDLDPRRAADLEELRIATGAETKRELFNNALTLFRWAVQQKRLGRSIGSIDAMENMTELVMPIFDRIETVSVDQESESQALGSRRVLTNSRGAAVPPFTPSRAH